MALLIIGLIIFLLSLSGFFCFFIKFKKNRDLNDIDQKNKTIFTGLCLSFVCGFMLFSFGIVLTNNMAITSGHIAQLFFASLFFSLSFYLLVSCFTIYYYKPSIYPGVRKIIHLLMFLPVNFYYFYHVNY